MSKKVGPLDIYNLLPRTNCGRCGESTCMAFATKLIDGVYELEDCPPLFEDPKYTENLAKLKELTRPMVAYIDIGPKERAVRIGGKRVLYRHELTYHNPTAIAIDVSDDLSDDEIAKRAKEIDEFKLVRIGEELKLDLIAVRSVTGDPKRFSEVVKLVMENTQKPLVLCSFDPEVLEAGLAVAKDQKPLIYAVTEKNWKDVSDLALMYDCPLAVFVPNDLKKLRSLVNTLFEKGIEKVALDPGTFLGEGFKDTINNFTMIRKAARDGDKLLGNPLIGVPLISWTKPEAVPELTKWREAWMACALLLRFADMLIMHSYDVWVQLPLLTLRQNIYTDPRKPVAVEPGLRVVGNPDENAPVMFTTNFALTYFTVMSDVEKLDCYLLVIDTEGLGVDSAIAGRKLTADKVAEAIKESGVEQKVKHRKIIVPQLAARLKGEIEDLSGWEVIVGPRDSSGIPGFLQECWKP